MLLLLYTAAGVQSEFLLSFDDVSRLTVHCKVILLSCPKAWLVSFNGLVRHCGCELSDAWPQVWQTCK